jgi:hypothetical protein
VIIAQIKNPSFIPCPHPTNPTLPSPHLKVHKLLREEMIECQLKGIFYNCDEKYFLGNKCKENFFFMAISKNIYEYDSDAYSPKSLPQPNDNIPPFDDLDVECLISLHALTDISTPQTLELIGYINHRK